MPYHIVIAVKCDDLAPVSEAVERITGHSGEGHESLYLGIYDSFRLPEELKVKYNRVEDDWDYPDRQDFPILLVAEATERPDYIEAIASQSGFEWELAEKTQW